MVNLQEVGDCLQKGVLGKEGGLSSAVLEGLSRGVLRGTGVSSGRFQGVGLQQGLPKET